VIASIATASEAGAASGKSSAAKAATLEASTVEATTAATTASKRQSGRRCGKYNRETGSTYNRIFFHIVFSSITVRGEHTEVVRVPRIPTGIIVALGSSL
jgi:hypothetical protein